MIKRVKKLIMGITITVVALLLLLVIGTTIFVNVSPQFGQAPTGDKLEQLKRSPNFNGKNFVNTVDTSTGEILEALKSMPKMLFGSSGNPTKPLPTIFSDIPNEVDSSKTYITWYGHSTFLIETYGQRILIDPMFGEVAAPVPFGTKRFKYDQALPVASIKNIDVVIISHDHYDHLDYPTIQKLKGEIKHFVTPLGIGSHLESWGIPEEDITELDWWQDVKLSDITFTATPSRHFSGRGITDRDATLWASWVIQTPSANLYYSGDSGYANHFQEIATKLGPFDFAMLECGQYNTAWNQIHMFPDQTVQAALDLNATLVMPIHWGAFRLAPHAWDESVSAFVESAKSKNINYTHPMIGQRFELGEAPALTEWWNNL
jgi:L-ascorbate metabolism protein UlaG (beta-lactamase superfamily)